MVHRVEAKKINTTGRQISSRGFLHWGLILIFLTVSSVSFAQKSKKVGDYTIHYVAYNSSFLIPEIAKAYGITRGSDIGVVNISVQKGDAVTGGIAAEISGKATNMIQQAKFLDFKEIKEGKATYYISAFKFDRDDPLTFKFDVTIKETGQRHTIKWQQMLWPD